MIDVCLWIVDTSRVSGTLFGLVALILAVLGWDQAVLPMVMIWAVPVVVSAAVLIVGAWIRDRVRGG